MAEKTIFAFHVDPLNGRPTYIGQVILETETEFRLQVVDGLMAMGCGMWQLTDELHDVPKAECRIFLTELACLEKAVRINMKKMDSRETL